MISAQQVPKINKKWLVIALPYFCLSQPLYGV